MKQDLTDALNFTLVRVPDDSAAPCGGCYFVNETTGQCRAPNHFPNCVDKDDHTQYYIFVKKKQH